MFHQKNLSHAQHIVGHLSFSSIMKVAIFFQALHSKWTSVCKVGSGWDNSGLIMK